jgi:copper chaperone CopZ
MRDAAATVVLAVDGMRCGGCARSLAFTLERLDGIQRAQVDRDRGQAAIGYHPACVDVAEIGS